jgi:hypothetical protein
LALLVIVLPDHQQTTPTRRSSSILPYNRSSTGSFYLTGANPDFLPSPLLSYSSSSTSTTPNITTNSSAKSGYPISFIHLGRQGTGTITLFAPTLASRRKWVDTIERYRHSVMASSQVFRMTEISHRYFNALNKVHCAATYGPYIIFGCDHGIYLKKPISTNNDDDDDDDDEDDDDEDDEDDEDIVQLVALEKVSQIDILECRRVMLVLADKTLYTYAMDTLLLVVDQPQQRKSMTSSRSSLDVGLKKQNQQQQRKISNNVSFFKVGQVYDKSSHHERTLVCYVKYNAMTSTIRTLELCHEEKRKSSRFLRNEVLKGFKDLYIPGEATSIQYFKHVICVGSAKGFQMVDIGSAGVQSKYTPTIITWMNATV